MSVETDTRVSVFINTSFFLLSSEDSCFKYLLASQCVLIRSTLGLLRVIPKNSTLLFHSMQAFCYSLFPPICFTPLSSFRYCYFLVALVTITGLSTPCLCLRFPIPAFDCLAVFSGGYLLLRVFLSCDKRDCLLIFPTVFKRTLCCRYNFSSVFQVTHQPCPKSLVAVRSVSVCSN